VAFPETSVRSALAATVEDAGFCLVTSRPSTITLPIGGFLIDAAYSLQLILDKERYNVG
jgi:hypothetical protein